MSRFSQVTRLESAFEDQSGVFQRLGHVVGYGRVRFAGTQELLHKRRRSVLLVDESAGFGVLQTQLFSFLQQDLLQHSSLRQVEQFELLVRGVVEVRQLARELPRTPSGVSRFYVLGRLALSSLEKW